MLFTAITQITIKIINTKSISSFVIGIKQNIPFSVCFSYCKKHVYVCVCTSWKTKKCLRYKEYIYIKNLNSYQ